MDKDEMKERIAEYMRALDTGESVCIEGIAEEIGEPLSDVNMALDEMLTERLVYRDGIGASSQYRLTSKGKHYGKDASTAPAKEDASKDQEPDPMKGPKARGKPTNPDLGNERACLHPGCDKKYYGKSARKTLIHHMVFEHTYTYAEAAKAVDARTSPLIKVPKALKKTPAAPPVKEDRLKEDRDKAPAPAEYADGEPTEMGYNVTPTNPLSATTMEERERLEFAQAKTPMATAEEVAEAESIKDELCPEITVQLRAHIVVVNPSPGKLRLLNVLDAIDVIRRDTHGAPEITANVRLGDGYDVEIALVEPKEAPPCP